MSDAREPDGTDRDQDLGAAFRQADAEARPRPEFRDALRRRFVAGDMAPAAPPSPRILSLPRWVLYPAAAAVLGAAFALSGALDGRAPVDPAIPMPEVVRTPEAALRAAEARVASVPALAGTAWQHRVIEGRPWLLPVTAAFADGKELRALGATMAGAEALLSSHLPGIEGRARTPVVTVVAPAREAFEALVAPLVAPAEVSDMTVAFALREHRVLLLAPEALAPGGPPCGWETTSVAHEAAHAWLHVRGGGGQGLPLWVDEGLAEAASGTDHDGKAWCADLLAYGRKEGFAPVLPAEVLSLGAYGDMARIVESRAPRSEEPYALMPLFYAHAESLVLFVTDRTAPERRAAFLRWLADRLDGKPTDPGATARDLGFADVEALFAARDAWLGL